MEKEQKIIAKKSLFSKILTILYYFFMLTWPLWIILPVVYYDAEHNAINSPHKTVGVVYKVGTSRVWHIYIMYYVNNEKYRTIVNPSKYGHNEIDIKENINDWVGSYMLEFTERVAVGLKGKLLNLLIK